MPTKPRLLERALSHQVKAAKQLAAVKSGILADDMGLGKTLTSILWLDYLKAKRLLVTAPKEVTSNLKEEIAKWTDRPVIDLRGMTKPRRDAIIEAVRSLDTFIILINLEAWSRDYTLLAGLISLQLEGIVVDEAHHLNNTKTLAFKGMRELVYAVNKCPSCAELAIPSYKCSRKGCSSGGLPNRFKYCMSCGFQQAFLYVEDCSCGYVVDKDLKNAVSLTGIITLTGTPVLNSPSDLWPLLYLTDAKNFPTKKDFTDNYCVHLGGNRYVFQPGAQEKLVRKMGRRYIQRSRKDAGIVLPPQTIEVLEYDRDLAKYPEQWKAYDQIERYFAIELESEVVPFTEVVVKLTRLRQMVTWPDGIQIRNESGEVSGQVHIGKSQKLDIVYDKICEYLACGQRVVAFSHFTAPLRELQRRLGSSAVVYDGSTPVALRERIRRDFASHHEYPEWQTLLCNYRSAGESLTLIGATQCVVIDEEWSPGKNNQAYRRIDRIGQTQETRIHIPRLSSTVDMWLAGLNKFKEQMAEEFSEKANYQSEILRAMRGEI